MTTQSFKLGPWTVEVQRGSVIGPDGNERHLEPKVMEVLACLAEHPDEVVSRQQLLDAVWGGSSGSDEQLTRAIGEARRAFEDDPVNPRFIETVPKRGYRLIGWIRPVDKQTPDGQIVARSIRQLGFRPIVAGIAIVMSVTLALVISRSYLIESAPDAVLTNDPSIAVLPFVNMSGDPDNEYFSDGISEEIINLLAQVPNLKVIGRTSSFAFKGQNEDLRDIGRALGVSTLLEGSVRRSDDTVRIVVQLVDAADGSHLWSDAYERTLTDIFAVQEEVASAVIDALQVHIVDQPRRGQPTENWEAYRSLLEARMAANRLDWEQAEVLAKQAVQQDPLLAEAHALLANVYWHMSPRTLDPADAQRSAYESASTAIAIDPDLAFAQAIKRSGNVGDSSILKHLEAFEWAYRVQPDNPRVLDALIYSLIYTGYLEEALQVARHYADVEPLSLEANLDLIGALYGAGQYEEANRVIDLLPQLGPVYYNWQWTIAGFELASGRVEGAKDTFVKLLEVHGYEDTDWVDELVTAALNSDSGQDYLDRRIPEIVVSLSEDDNVNWRMGLINWYLFLGYLDKYYELILAPNPQSGAWIDADEQIWHGHALRLRGFTAHSDYVRFVTDLGVVDVWEKRGPPDFCRKTGGNWICE